jgi:hypothetical protein
LSDSADSFKIIQTAHMMRGGSDYIAGRGPFAGQLRDPVEIRNRKKNFSGIDNT